MNRGGTGGGGQVSPTSTRGVIENSGGGSWYGENDNGYSVSILDGGSSDINAYRYGSRRVYEVRTYDPNGSQVGQTSYPTTKADALSAGKNWLNQHKG